jgi:hypothetical protein
MSATQGPEIAFIVSRPSRRVSDPPENYKVTLFDGNVNGITPCRRSR